MLHTLHPSPLAINCRNLQKRVAYFSYLAPLTLFFFTKRRSQKGGPWLNASPLNTLLDLSTHNRKCMNKKCTIFGETLRFRGKKSKQNLTKNFLESAKMVSTVCKFSKVFRGSMPPHPPRAFFSSIYNEMILPEKKKNA